MQLFTAEPGITCGLLALSQLASCLQTSCRSSEYPLRATLRKALLQYLYVEGTSVLAVQVDCCPRLGPSKAPATRYSPRPVHPITIPIRTNLRGPSVCANFHASITPPTGNPNLLLPPHPFPFSSPSSPSVAVAVLPESDVA